MSANIAEEQAANAALNGHVAPHAPAGDGGEAPMEETGPDASAEDGNLNGTSTYAQIASSVKTLELHLYREDKGTDFNVNYEEISNLLYKRLLLPEGTLVSLDTTPLFIKKKIIIEIDGSVDITKLNITQALEVKKGMKTRPIQSPDTDREVRITRAPMKMDNAEISKVIAIFGEITSPLQHVVFENPPAGGPKDSWRFLMRGVKLAERTVRLKIKVNIPTIIVVQGLKLRINYAGQPQTCPRCQKYWGSCPGGGKVEKCKKANGEEKDAKATFKQLVARIKKKDKEVADIESSAPLVPAMIPDPDQISFSGLPEDMTLDGFQAWLDASSVTFLSTMCFKGGRPGTFVISSYEDEKDGLVKLNSGEAQEIVTKLHGTEVNRKRVTVQMEALSTPSRKKIEVVTLDETDPQAVAVANAGDGGPGGVVRDLKAEKAAKKKERRKKAQEAKKKAKEEAKKSEAGATSGAEKEKKKKEDTGLDDDEEFLTDESEFMSPEVTKNKADGALKTTTVGTNGKGAKRLPESSPGSPATTDAEGSPILNSKKTSPWNSKEKGGGKQKQKKLKHVL